MIPIRAWCFVLAFCAPAMALGDTNARFEDQRLFTTAAQRERLDAIRAGTSPPEPEAGRTRAAPVPPPPKPPPVSLDGFVSRGDGRSAVWANGTSTLRGSPGADLRVHGDRIQGSAVVITLPDGRTIRLKPGQRWDPDSERVIDPYKARR